MSVSDPFRLTSEDVRRAGLEPGDVEAWCIIVAGCYHLFASEAAAKWAHAKMLDGELVR